MGPFFTSWGVSHRAASTLASSGDQRPPLQLQPRLPPPVMRANTTTTTTDADTTTGPAVPAAADGRTVPRPRSPYGQDSAKGCFDARALQKKVSKARKDGTPPRSRLRLSMALCMVLLRCVIIAAADGGGGRLQYKTPRRVQHLHRTNSSSYPLVFAIHCCGCRRSWRRLTQKENNEEAEKNEKKTFGRGVVIYHK